MEAVDTMYRRTKRDGGDSNGSVCETTTNNGCGETIKSRGPEKSTVSNGASSERAAESTEKRTRNGGTSKITGRTSALVGIAEMPTHLQFNRYIFHGYRPLASTWECVKSLFSLHNETINILTHGIPLTYIMWNASSLMPWNEIAITGLPYFHIAATMSPWLGSFIYHLFMNHNSGEELYNKLLQVDMFGIWFTQSIGALTTIYASIYCLPVSAQRTIFAFYFALSAMALYKALVAVSPWERRLSFALQVVLRTALLALRLTRYGGGDPRSVMHVVLQDLLAVIGGAIGAVRIPEKWFPGKLDIIGNSHHIMHVLVVLAICHMHWAASLDMVWITQKGEAQCIINLYESAN